MTHLYACEMLIYLTHFYSSNFLWTTLISPHNFFEVLCFTTLPFTYQTKDHYAQFIYCIKPRYAWMTPHHFLYHKCAWITFAHITQTWHKHVTSQYLCQNEHPNDIEKWKLHGLQNNKKYFNHNLLVKVFFHILTLK